MSEQAITVSMSHAEAERLTERLRIAVVNYADARKKVQALIERAQAGRAWEVLGFQSWTAYVSEVLGEQPMRLPREERREMVAMLSSTGMSTRAIAPVVGANQATVTRDIRASDANASLGPSAARGLTNSTVSNETVELSTNASGPTYEESVTGLNGKTYARPIRTPKAPNYPGEYRDAVISLNNAVHRLLRTHEDKRMARNAQKVATVNRSDLLRAIDALQRAVADLDAATSRVE